MDFGSDTVVVPRHLLSEILEDGICPLHLRIQIQRLLSAPSAPPGEASLPRFASRSQRLCAKLRTAPETPEDIQISTEVAEAPALDTEATTVSTPAVVAAALPEAEGDVSERPQEPPEAAELADSEDTKKEVDLPTPSPEELAEARRLDQEERLRKQKLQLEMCQFRELLSAPCLVLVVCGLPLPEILALRAVNSSALHWAMDSAIAHLGEVCQAHHRIRTRLWIQRLEEINRHTTDESLYDSKVRRLADEALRRRMEAEMADARQDMENRIRDFHVEVDRRMEAQAVRVHAIVEERVQQQLDTILAAEMEKVRVLVEERVQGRVRQVVQREVYATVCEMQAKLATLAKENEKLRAVFLEHLEHSDLCFRSLVWALSPTSTGLFARTLRLIWCCRRRFTRFSAWMLGVPMDSRRDILRQRLELMHYLGSLRHPDRDRESPRRHERASELGRQKLLAALQGVEAAEAEALSEDSSSEVARAQDDRHVQPGPLERAVRDLPRTSGELVAAALSARRQVQGERVQEQRQRRPRSSSQDSSEARLTEPPSEDDADSEDIRQREDADDLFEEGVIEVGRDTLRFQLGLPHERTHEANAVGDDDTFEDIEDEEFFELEDLQDLDESCAEVPSVLNA
mmetsp:Transcript_80673/g.164189  ORF Transcript_80673/g.164189 Transcript_80673/m.164189 type:complete len:630 (+) Transcript_80673:62-1951(+)